MSVVGCLGGRGAGAEATGAGGACCGGGCCSCELVAERSCDELVVVALRRRELRSQAADVGGSRGDRRHCRHCCNLKADHDLPAWYAMG